MTKEQCSLQPNYYGSSCDFQDLQSAVQQLTTKTDAQFEELKNEKWFHRIFNMVVCPRKNNIRMAEQITSLAQAQGILIEILVRLADQDANIAEMVMQSQSDIRALAQNSAYLQERLYLLEDKSYGIKENENLKDLNSQQRNILSGCLNEASKLYAMPSNEQRLYANELLNYLNADAQVANLEDALDDLEDNAKRKILSCVITYMYLYDHTAESMEQDEQEDFIDLFDLGRKTIKSLKQQTVDTYRLRGVDGCIDRYITAPIEITEETPFEVELPEPKAAEGASEAQAEENGEEAIDTNAPREKLVLSGSIQNDGETIYKNKEIHFSSAIVNCKGTVKFINCDIHYNEDSGSHIYLNDETELSIMASTITCHGASSAENYFVQIINGADDSISCTIKDSRFIDCVAFIKGSYTTFNFENNHTQGSCSNFMTVGGKEACNIINNYFIFPDKPTVHVEEPLTMSGCHFFINLDGNNALVSNSIFECEKGIRKSTYMDEKNIYAIDGPSWCSDKQVGMVSNCTFTRMNNCVYQVGTVKNCVFDGCSNAIRECTSQITENRFSNCEHVCIKLKDKVVVSNCQFTRCTGTNLVESDSGARITIEDCEFSNILMSKFNSVDDILKDLNKEVQKYTHYSTKGSLIKFGYMRTKTANAKGPSKITRCVFNGIRICPSGGFACIKGVWKMCNSSESNWLVDVERYDDKYDSPRAIIADCTFTNCAAEQDDIIHEYYDYKPVFGKTQYHRLIRLDNNSGLDNIGNPSSFVESDNIKLKETDANGNKIGSSLSVN